MIREFREFIMRGNVFDLAIAVIIGGAFGKIVTSLVTDIIMPPIGLLLSSVDFTNLFIDISGGGYKTLADAKKAGAATLNYGLFINTVIDFIFVSFIIFLLIRAANRMKLIEEKKIETKECPYCFSQINKKALKCPHCTTELSINK